MEARERIRCEQKLTNHSQRSPKVVNRRQRNSGLSSRQNEIARYSGRHTVAQAFSPKSARRPSSSFLIPLSLALLLFLGFIFLSLVFPFLCLFLPVLLLFLPCNSHYTLQLIACRFSPAWNEYNYPTSPSLKRYLVYYPPDAAEFLCAWRKFRKSG